MYTWDINASKLFYLRSVLNDTLMRYFLDYNLNRYWKYVGFDSNSGFVGLNIMQELGKTISACFLDSDHTLSTLMKEVEAVSEMLDSGSVIVIDDGNLSYKLHNMACINMIRRKLGLAPKENPSNNTGRYFWQEVEDYLRKKFKRIEYIDDSYKKNYQNDISIMYYKNDKEAARELLMERAEGLEKRFNAWRIFK